MHLTQAQIEQFQTEGWLFLPELFTPEEVAILREESATVRRSGARRTAPRARRLRPTPTTRRSRSSAATRA
jgi:hypothetical protein